MMGKVIMSGIVPQLVAPINYPKNFADATWEQIIEACQRKAVPDTWEVGDQKAMTINGTSYMIDIIGKDHDDYADGTGTAPLTFQMHDCYGTKYNWNSTQTNIGGWESCAMRNTNLPAILAVMPAEVREAIKEVNKLANGTGGNGAITIKTSADKLFLLSVVEVTGTNRYAAEGEGKQYAYYAAGNSASKKRPDGNNADWWLRSANTTSATYVCFYASAGQTASFTGAQNALDVSFAFCF